MRPELDLNGSVRHSELIQTLCPVAVLSTALDLVDLSDPAQPREHRVRKSPLRRKAGSRSPRHRTRTEETELIQVQVEPRPASPRTPERISLDSGKSCWPRSGPDRFCLLRGSGWTPLDRTDGTGHHAGRL